MSGALRRAAYAAPILPLAIVQAPALSVLPSIYAKEAGVSLAALGTVLFVTRLFDAVIDPSIGYLSDGTRSRWGPRKLWIALGALIVAVGCWFWFRPSPGTGVGYFLLWSLVVYLGWSLLEVPHSAWLADLSDDYDERSRLSAWRSSAELVGRLLFFIVPLLPIFSTTEITGETTRVVSWLALILLPVTIAISFRFAPKGRPVAIPEADRNPLKVLRGVWRNRPFRVLFIALLLGQVASGMVGALYVFYMGAYLGIADKVAHVAVGVSLIMLASTQVWPLAMKRIGKHGALAVGVFGTAATLVLMAFLRPGPLAFPGMLLVFGLSSITAASLNVAMFALMADVADYDEWRTGRNNAASYFSLVTLIVKIGMAVGGGVSLIVAGLFGFDPQGGNRGWAMGGFFLAFIIVPILLNLISFAFAARFPLNRRRQSVVARRLAARRARETLLKSEA
ncbi:MFS transporter [Brevundimonas sp. SORGH_AS_0993]|uniref:MFS transporter n=1 Tax=Brevundimonas sp. SORGH_AS_0993 TaxID=3041794 RepID=UPI002788CA66|nr:MFS transporter [Brevundimonas sp. SORGH_AS_0993]MDQ1154625.1 GPH family glycoside/pentoside/hexuronide:cation symporter [Brevundimonas sp. SORGH_AS_0993]